MEEKGDETKVAEENNEEATRSPALDEMLDEFGKDYASYLQVDSSREKHQFEESVEDMLTRLDEFCGLVDLIRSDSTLCLKTTLPKIQAKSAEMEKMFERIDKLESFVSLVKQNLNATEEQVSKAEDELGSFSSFKKMLNSFSVPSFLSSKKPSTPVKAAKETYSPLEVIDCNNFFSSTTSDSKSSGGQATSITQLKDTENEATSSEEQMVASST
ncbi:biogenesis of lysosome-related organelles complex 1 subunit 4 [Lingula anatina]|uniref:Biogenesis of lysosome-related organelles complex 1 subunit 4 n=1 Tax=Lingula anatina TaxID=7574 RepID=A0A1S3I319_LINAN|nr:biogenesis of lysosome-related organelles complex 1 subunit 4 [Lingula anatina]|eukprot:XP_013392628.1 biogenesis of lysosome-related organelles complex 1 subunit 4 [Lingula anatina]